MFGRRKKTDTHEMSAVYAGPEYFAEMNKSRTESQTDKERMYERETIRLVYAGPDKMGDEVKGSGENNCERQSGKIVPPPNAPGRGGGKFCRLCGSMVDRSARFCNVCGGAFPATGDGMGETKEAERKPYPFNNTYEV